MRGVFHVERSGTASSLASARSSRLSPVSMGYTKLYSGLVFSTVWREDMHVKIVWITLLALSDAGGIVSASVPGLAAAAAVTVEQCLDALTRLSSPDTHSRTKEYEGRRIEEVDGGWFILNYGKYREMRDEERRKEQVRQAVARYRDRQKAAVINGHQSKPRKPRKAQADSKAEAVRTTDLLPACNVSVSASVQAPDSPLVEVAAAPDPDAAWSRDACDAWAERFGGEVPGGQIGRALKPLVRKHGWTAVRPAWRTYLGQAQAEYASAARFAATFGDWAARVSRPLPL